MSLDLKGRCVKSSAKISLLEILLVEISYLASND